VNGSQQIDSFRIGAEALSPEMGDNVFTLRSREVLITEELASRPRKAPNLEAQARAFRELSNLIVDNPKSAVTRFLELAIALCEAGSAGLSLLETDDLGQAHFRWDTLAGPFDIHKNGITQRDFSPCGLCLDAGHTILVSRPFNIFGYLNAAARPVVEGLIVPLYDTGRTPLGTIWIVHHDEQRRFDAEDARVMEQLAVQLVLALKFRRDRSDAAANIEQVRSLRAQNAGLIDESAFLKSVLESSGDCVKVLDLAGRLLFMNEAGIGRLEIENCDKLIGRPWIDLWGHCQTGVVQEAIDAAKRGETGRFRAPANTIKGTQKHWDVQITPIRDETGAPKQLLVISRDVSDEHKAEEHRRLLSNELEHRIKNTLAVVGAIVSQTFRVSASKDEALEMVLARVLALSHAHDILTKTSWIGAAITDVVEGALAPHHTNDGRFRVGGPALLLSARRSLSLALAIHELATNAAKYGALSNDNGHIEVSWTLEATKGEGAFQFDWREIDGPLVKEPERRGFGSRLIERVLANDFNGEAGIEFASSGVHCWVISPLKDFQATSAG
jgi:PAS domain S-box-containing protein